MAPRRPTFYAGVSIAAAGWLVLDPLVALLVAANIVWTVTAHLEPLEDPASWDDRGLHRRE